MPQIKYRKSSIETIETADCHGKQAPHIVLAMHMIRQHRLRTRSVQTSPGCTRTGYDGIYIVLNHSGVDASIQAKFDGQKWSGEITYGSTNRSVSSAVTAIEVIKSAVAVAAELEAMQPGYIQVPDSELQVGVRYDEATRKYVYEFLEPVPADENETAVAS